MTVLVSIAGIAWLTILSLKLQKQRKILMQTRSDLNVVIAGLPAEIAAAVQAAQAANPPVTPVEDFQPEVDALNKVPAAVAAALFPATPVQP